METLRASRSNEVRRCSCFATSKVLSLGLGQELWLPFRFPRRRTVETYTYTERAREHAGNSNKHLIKGELPANTNASRVLCTILARNHGNNVHEIPVLAAPGQRLL